MNVGVLQLSHSKEQLVTDFEQRICLHCPSEMLLLTLTQYAFIGTSLLVSGVSIPMASDRGLQVSWACGNVLHCLPELCDAET